MIKTALKRAGIETRLVIGKQDFAPASGPSIKAIQEALIKALQWNQELLDGSVPSMTALARKYHVTQRYIAHLIKLAYLPPHIMTAIHKGDIPPMLTLDRLKKGIPLDWNDSSLFPPTHH